MNIAQKLTSIRNTGLNTGMFAISLALAVILTALLTGYAPQEVCAQNVIKPAPAKNGIESLEGRWIRPDGGYILDLRNVKKDGSLSASYFNPRPIRVFRAQAAEKNGRITLFVEFRDINYPGSTYTLQYEPKTDQLTGEYYQAVMKQTFDVVFVRAK